MVTRKPLPDNPPYPTSPSPSHPSVLPPSGSSSTVGNSAHLGPTVYDGSESDDDEWEKSDSDWEMEGDAKPSSGDLPAPLRISRPNSRQSAHDTEIPQVLRVGPPGGVPPEKSTENLQKSKESLALDANNPWKVETKTPTPPVQLQSYNPFLRPQNTGQAIFGGESSSSVWRGAPPVSTQSTGASVPIAELPIDHTPTDKLSNMTLSELPAVSSPISTMPPILPAEPYSEKEAVVSKEDSIASSVWDPQMDLSSLDAFSSRGHGVRENSIPETQRTWQEQQAWDHSQREGRQLEAAAASQRAERAERERLAEEESHSDETGHTAGEGIPPSLPPRKSLEDQSPPKPPRHHINTTHDSQGGERSGAESPNTVIKKQRNQTYQIKKVRWFDASSQNSRVSPILIQNANGPCPLLALVNALTLSTPVSEETVLVETLRTREQVSLGLLVEAVFEELMSGRRGDAAQDLPDVGDLYSFLITLHTGMNVNPRFVFVPDRSSMDMHPALRPTTQAGVFEETREMKLYSTFNIPLMHGWLPTRDSSAYAAFERSAKTYEDAQNIQFYEEELEAKINTTGLNSEEQQLFEDLHIVKQFLASWPTQLTEHGLKAVTEHLKPGDFAILFRNDHFSTIYKEPRSGSLLTLVTDAGYSSHAEIVWESLVDLNGNDSEHYSGDFRPVSHNQTAEAGPAGPRGSSLSQQPVQSMLDVDQGWTSVQGKNKRRDKTGSGGSFVGQQSGLIGSSSAAATEDPVSVVSDVSKAEQEDHDLALALQLQEEEEERHNREQTARRREQELSQEVLEQQRTPTARPPNVQTNRPLIPPRRGGAEDAPPPTYEQASKDRRFVPPRDHPASPHAPIGAGLSRQQSAYMQTSGPSSVGQRPQQNPSRRNSRPGALIDQIPPAGLGRGGRRHSAGYPGAAHGPGIPGRDEKCTIM